MSSGGLRHLNLEPGTQRCTHCRTAPADHLSDVCTPCRRALAEEAETRSLRGAGEDRVIRTWRCEAHHLWPRANGNTCPRCGRPGIVARRATPIGPTARCQTKDCPYLTDHPSGHCDDHRRKWAARRRKRTTRT